MSSSKYANLPIMDQEESKPGMVGVRLEGELMAKIREQAKREHRTLAGMVRVFILESIERREGPYPQIPWMKFPVGGSTEKKKAKKKPA